MAVSTLVTFENIITLLKITFLRDALIFIDFQSVLKNLFVITFIFLDQFLGHPFSDNVYHGCLNKGFVNSPLALLRYPPLIFLISTMPLSRQTKAWPVKNEKKEYLDVLLVLC